MSDPQPSKSATLSIPDAARGMGVHITGARGSGKSRLMGRVFAWGDFIRDLPVVVIDPMGAVVDNVMDKILRVDDREKQKALWHRVHYIDTAGTYGSVTPFPLYYALPGDSLSTIAGRFTDVVLRLDPALHRAPIHGANAVKEIGTPVGMILSSLGLPITEARTLLMNPEKYLRQVQRRPDVEPAVDYFHTKYLPLTDTRQRDLTSSYLAKVELFQYDPVMRAMFTATTPGLDWAEVMAKRKLVLIDLSKEQDREHKRFKMLWIYSTFRDFIKKRGAGRDLPITLIIDELVDLVGEKGNFTELMVEELNTLIQVLARNLRVHIVLAHQEMNQLPEVMQNAVMGIGTHFWGATDDEKTARMLASRYYPFNPHEIKEVRRDRYNVITRINYYTREEQIDRNAPRFQKPPKFTFRAAVTVSEGQTAKTVTSVSIKKMDPDQYPDKERCMAVRQALSNRDGVPLAKPETVFLDTRPSAAESPLRPRRRGPVPLEKSLDDSGV